MKSMKDQYGSKRGEQVFYASMNKGKIKGVEKKKNGGLGEKYGPPPKKGPSSQGIIVKKLSVGGGADMGASAGSPGPGDTGGAGGYGKSTSQFGASTGSVNKSTPNPPSVKKSTNIPPVTPFGMTVQLLKTVENQRRAKRAKGEYYLTNKKIMPINRDFYRQYGRKLDTKIGSADEPYMKEAGIIGFKKFGNPDNGGPTLCPNGSLPPCIDTTKAVTPGGKNPVTPYKFNFEYKEGGLVRGSGKILKDRVKKARIY